MGDTSVQETWVWQQKSPPGASYLPMGSLILQAFSV
jgi:hypothetical protein